MMEQEKKDPNPPTAKIRMAVLIGGGSKLRPIYEYAQQAEAKAEIVVVASFKKASSGLAWAAEQGLATETRYWLGWRKRGKTREEFDAAITQLLEEYRVELVVLAGWGLILTEPFLKRWAAVTLNIHPALLTDTLAENVILANGQQIPVFRGNHAIELAWQANVAITGCSVHYVTPEMDVGPVILKKEVPRLAGDTLETLAARVHAAEDEILPLAIDLAAERLLANRG